MFIISNKSCRKKYSSSEESESSYEESSSDNEETVVKKITNYEPIKLKEENSTNNVVENKKSNLDLLLDFCDATNEAPVMTPSLGGFFTPSTPIEAPLTMQSVQPVFSNTKPVELLNRINGRGLSATYRFTRSPHLYSPSMANINIMFVNNTNEDINDIRLGRKVKGYYVVSNLLISLLFQNLAVGMSIHDFACIAKLPPNCSLPATLGIDFNDTTQPANFEIVSSIGK